MATISQSLQEAFQKHANSLTIPIQDSTNDTTRLVKKTLAEIHLNDVPTYTCTPSFEIFDSWSFSSTVLRVQYLPIDTWKRIAIFASTLTIGYLLHKGCASYFSLNFLLGSMIMSGALFKTFKYVQQATFPKVLKIDLAYRDCEPIDHAKLANGKEGENFVDPFTLNEIPPDKVHSPKYIHLSNWILEADSCMHGLLEKPGLKHPIETKRDLTDEEYQALTTQICRVFNLLLEELLSCWSDFEATESEKIALLKEKFQNDGLLSSEARKAVEESFPVPSAEYKIRANTQAMLAVIMAKQELFDKHPMELIQIKAATQRCLDTCSSTDFTETLSLLGCLFTTLPECSVSVSDDFQKRNIDIRSILKITHLEALQKQIQPPPPLQENFFQARLRWVMSWISSPSKSLQEEKFEWLDNMIAEEKPIETITRKQLEEIFGNPAMSLLFVLTETFRDEVTLLESRKRHQKFTDLTGVDLTKN